VEETREVAQGFSPARSFRVPGSGSTFEEGSAFEHAIFSKEEPRSEVVAPPRTWNWNRNLEPGVRRVQRAVRVTLV
jgi:hypothetical protein